MDSLPRPRRHVAARILTAIVIVPMLLAACSGGTGAAAPPPAATRPRWSRTPSRRPRPRTSRASAASPAPGRSSRSRKTWTCRTPFGGAIPGVDAAALADSVTIDTSGVTVGTAAISGDTATVPVTGTMKMTFDKEKIRPIIKQVMEAQGGGITMTDEQIDQILDQMGGAAGQGIPVDESMTLKQENGAWKICEPSSGSDGGAPSASLGY